LIGPKKACFERVNCRSSSVVDLAGVLTDVSRRDASQLRDSDGITPFFPRFLLRLTPEKPVEEL
jgi:hypothetical protein